MTVINSGSNFPIFVHILPQLAPLKESNHLYMAWHLDAEDLSVQCPAQALILQPEQKE